MIEKKVTIVDVYEWDELVKSTYGKDYNFQQQDDCKPRGIHKLAIPISDPEDFEATSIPVEVNGNTIGVSFEAWLGRDVNEKPDDWTNFDLRLFWARSFYPDVEMIANDLYKRGLIAAGDYLINIDW